MTLDATLGRRPAYRPTMAYDDTREPSDGTPPREVRSWTGVSGHTVASRDKPTAFCQCGERRPQDHDGTGEDWAREHLGLAWPVLVPHDEGEDREAYVQRLLRELDDAMLMQNRLDIEAGLDQPVRPGQPFPVITEEMIRAGERVEVLQHQIGVAARWHHDGD